jgi:hypothetical protein
MLMTILARRVILPFRKPRMTLYAFLVMAATLNQSRAPKPSVEMALLLAPSQNTECDPQLNELTVVIALYQTTVAYYGDRSRGSSILIFVATE